MTIVGHSLHSLAALHATVQLVATPLVTPVPRPTTAPAPLLVPTQVPGAQVPHAAVLNSALEWLIALLLVLVVGMYLVSLVQRIRTPNFYQLPYSFWFVQHYDLAVIALGLIVFLGITGTVNAEVVSGLFAGVVGYVLGNTGGLHSGKTDSGQSVAPFSRHTGYGVCSCSYRCEWNIPT
jgi:hypothetical protein